MSRRPNRSRDTRVSVDATRDRRRVTALPQRGETPAARDARLNALRATLTHA
ncbi:hypothetical protein LG299_02705 [Microbacterium lacus]|uniref:hypothetical protein n=1 Tax=Microbacterium lacus TaxID=415217 RepID=UPI00384EF573